MSYRLEKDFLGEVKIEKDKYYGINTYRALENFSVSEVKVDFEIIQAMVEIKKAAAQANANIGKLNETKLSVIVKACDLILEGNYQKEFELCAIQGGAGTSVNMNVNEVIANIGLESMGYEKGMYEYLHPINDVNMSQSTNDTYGTAIKIAAIRALKRLSNNLAKLQEAFQKKENEFSSIIKVGRTQLQDAVPITLGQEFGAYAQAISRDRWRLYKCEERLRVINIGGTAVGTGINADLKYIFYVTENLRKITGIGLARSEYMIDTTQNCDAFVEVSGLLKTAATNLCKIANDLRLLSSGPIGGFGEISIPKLQAGSSIMPGKVNPVIPELINQISFIVTSNDLAITLAAQAGQLELNAMLPLIAYKIMDSIKIMDKSITIFIEKCINGVLADVDRCNELISKSYCMSAALVPYIGYDAASKIAKDCIKTHKDIFTVTKEVTDMDDEKLKGIFDCYKMTTPGVRGRVN